MTAIGRYITATSTYYGDGTGAAKYGIFTSNITEDPAYGESLLDYSYSNNMADSAYYIGASPDNNIVLRHGHAQNSALGYSGTNGSGRVILELTEWDHLRAGIVPNTLNNDDAPSPQTGLCPAGKYSNDPRVPQNICFIVRDNYVHDNNNPDAPGSGIAGEAPVGAGIELSGTVWDAVVGNTVTNNGSWGIVMHDFPDTETFPGDLPPGTTASAASAPLAPASTPAARTSRPSTRCLATARTATSPTATCSTCRRPRT